MGGFQRHPIGTIPGNPILQTLIIKSVIHRKENAEPVFSNEGVQTMTETNIFTQYMQKRNVIVKNKKILQSSYIPENLPHRSDKINEIVEIIAPALKANSHGIKGVIQEAHKTTKTPKTGSTSPESAPKAKAFFAL